MKVYVVIRRFSTHNSVSNTHLFSAMVYWSCQYFKGSHKWKMQICPWSLAKVFHVGITCPEYSYSVLGTCV